MATNENDIYNLKTIVREFEINRRIGFKETMLFCESTMITEMVVSITKKKCTSEHIWNKTMYIFLMTVMNDIN